MSWFLVILFLSLTFDITHSEASHDKKLPSAVVVGTVYCDTCFQQDLSTGNHFISGAFPLLDLFFLKRFSFISLNSYTHALNFDYEVMLSYVFLYS
uniref:Uncharacterized protein n=1 Tax=Glycine max TaxID=3847 RepID=C6T4U9_SOYBN|nr:unknown [Glycine max]